MDKPWQLLRLRPGMNDRMLAIVAGLVLMWSIRLRLGMNTSSWIIPCLTNTTPHRIQVCWSNILWETSQTWFFRPLLQPTWFTQSSGRFRNCALFGISLGSTSVPSAESCREIIFDYIILWRPKPNLLKVLYMQLEIVRGTLLNSLCNLWTR